jgi:ABC-type multidrug transport system permease subunit
MAFIERTERSRTMPSFIGGVASRDRLSALAIIAVVGVVAAGAPITDAVANRFVSKLGVSGVSFSLSNLLDTLLKPAGGAGKSEINELIVAIVALVLLSAIVYFLFGVMRTLMGRRGGVEVVGQVVFALIMGIAVLSVLA